MNKPKLLPCPFCGRLPKWEGGLSWEEAESMYGEGWKVVIDCMRCEASLQIHERESLEHFCERWNRRAKG